LPSPLIAIQHFSCQRRMERTNLRSIRVHEIQGHVTWSIAEALVIDPLSNLDA
jgi:hypothetical protein